MGHTRAWGEKMEGVVCKWLSERGYQILARNYRCRYGEVDIVALENDCLVLVEVKARRSTKFGNPADAVNSKKLEKIGRTGESFRSTYDSDLPEAMRIDVVEVLVRGGRTGVRLLRSVC